MTHHPHPAAYGPLHAGGSHISPVFRLQHIKPCQCHREAKKLYLIIGILQFRLLEGRHRKPFRLGIEKGTRCFALAPVDKHVSLPQEQRLALSGETERTRAYQYDGLFKP